MKKLATLIALTMTLLGLSIATASAGQVLTSTTIRQVCQPGYKVAAQAVTTYTNTDGSVAAATQYGPWVVMADAWCGGLTHDTCREEDGSGQKFCIWDARARGNGLGKSFIAIHGGTDRAHYIYISHRTAYRLTR